ncbi:hypothetical protein [Sandarakinorhabdus sp.]|uniref:hypothetical protein n=1 Tax=Sandarakinorhabdus sp. TaxID=1916663 RepID=UPI00286E3287|nr:hypothetical protein [Sandarakinorhabdus sp.]
MTATERRAILFAGSAHIALFAALSIGWQFASSPLPPADTAMPVEIVDTAELARITQPPTPSAEAAPQESAAAAPQEDAAPEPEPAPTDAVPPPEPAKPKPQAAAPKAPPGPLDTTSLASLIDKALPKSKIKPLDTSKLAKDINAAQPQGARVDPRAAATLAQAIQAQVAPCWNPPTGGRDVRKMTVVVRVEYGRDGRVIGVPVSGQPTGATAGNADYARAFADTARRAVLRCQPLKLPPELYELWQSVEINFDPESMA